jgi:hypothetical protein
MTSGDGGGAVTMTGSGGIDVLVIILMVKV